LGAYLIYNRRRFEVCGGADANLMNILGMQNEDDDGDEERMKLAGFHLSSSSRS